MSSSPESASRLEELEAGLAALQSENYPKAIAHLSKFLSSESDLEQPHALKARIGLVQAQLRCGQTEAAIALCQDLQQSQNQKARSWAAQTIAKLTATETGFVPLEVAPPTRRTRIPRSREPQVSQPKGSRPKVSQPIPVQQEFPQAPQPPGAPPQTPELPESAQLRTTPHLWQNAGRAQRWQPLRQLNPARLQWAELGTVVALFLTLYGLWSSAIAASWMWFNFRRFLNLSPAIPDGEVSVLVLGLSLVIAFLVAPWVLDAILRHCYGMKPLPTAALCALHNAEGTARQNAETHRLLQRFAQQQKIPVPKLGILPIQAPLAFTYGCLPKFARIVVSQGLLNSLAEDEIAAIYACELGHIAHWDFVWMSLIAAVIQIPYTLYRQCAIASDTLGAIKLQNVWAARLAQLLAKVMVVISALAYGAFSLFRWSGLWLSRARIAYSDRYACNLTGNPNGLARALVKLAVATTQTVQQEKQTHDLLESFELFNPISYRSAMTVGSLFDRVSISTLFQWEQANHARFELMLNQPHSLLGIRLNQIMSYCQAWQLTPEFEIEKFSSENRHRNLLDLAPLLGIAVGNAIAFLLWLIAHSLHHAGIYQFNWLANDYSLFTAFSLIGFGLGVIVRFNRFFPESRPASSDLIHLLTQVNLTSIDSPRIRLEGILIGRTGARNQLGQDLILQTELGLIKLNYESPLGAIGNLLCRFPIGQTVTITGWFRRDATPRIDVETMRGRSLLAGGHQTGSILIAIAAILLGLLQVV